MPAEPEIRVPRWVLWTVLVIIVVTVAFAGVSRATRQADAGTPVVESVQVTFTDRPGGGVQVAELSTGVVITEVAPGEDGFIRGVIRGLNRGRKLEGADRGRAFDLARHADGTLSLGDPVTGTRITLDAFGATNVEAFARLLDAGRRVTR